MGKLSVPLLALFIVALSWRPFLVNASEESDTEEMGLDARLSYDSFAERMQKAYRYHGRQRRGVSRKNLKKKFKAKLHERVNDFMEKSFGGTIEEVGEVHNVAVCGQRPTLTMDEVKELAHKSFDITDFTPAIPPCDKGARVVKCKYDTGRCCQRPQVQFIGRYYDTAIAAMALGATTSEAFAPLVHARALAYALEACDPDINYKGNFYANSVTFQARVRYYGTRKRWHGWGLSLIAFPQSYEVFYELYNTMLIERLRSRASTKFPSRAQMKVLRERVYYKKLLTRVAPLSIELKENQAFPVSKDFKAAGLTMVKPQDIGTSRFLSADDTGGVLPGNVYMNSTLRASLSPISVYEKQSKTRQKLNLARCNRKINGEAFFQFKIKDSVWNKYEACCAKECKFMARYGKTFSAGRANCCAGCSRAKCSANTAKFAELLAEKVAIESPSKKNSGAMQVTMTV